MQRSKGRNTSKGLWQARDSPWCSASPQIASLPNLMRPRIEAVPTKGRTMPHTCSLPSRLACFGKHIHNSGWLTET